MNELVQHTSLYKYQNTGQNPHQPNKDKEECDVPNPILLDQAPSSTADHEPSKGGNKNVEVNLSSSNQNKYQIESDQNQPGKQITPLFYFGLVVTHLLCTACFININKSGRVKGKKSGIPKYH